MLVTLTLLLLGLLVLANLGLADWLMAWVREALQDLGADPAALDIGTMFTPSGLYAAVDTLPAPLDLLGKLVLTLVLLGLALSLVASLVGAVLRVRNWVRDLLV